eukprot:6485801-Amphidinium_carterae.1
MQPQQRQQALLSGNQVLHSVTSPVLQLRVQLQRPLDLQAAQEVHELVCLGACSYNALHDGSMLRDPPVGSLQQRTRHSLGFRRNAET